MKEKKKGKNISHGWMAILALAMIFAMMTPMAGALIESSSATFSSTGNNTIVAADDLCDILNISFVDNTNDILWANITLPSDALVLNNLINVFYVNPSGETDTATTTVSSGAWGVNVTFDNIAAANNLTTVYLNVTARRNGSCSINVTTSNTKFSIPITIIRGNVTNENTSVYYNTIQGAVDAASAGDTIFVRKGTYPEHVTIEKELSLIGEDKNNTIIDGSGSGKCIYIATDFRNPHEVNVSGFTVQNAEYGVYIYTISASKITVEDNIVKSNKYGIDIERSHSPFLLLRNNYVHSNTAAGVRLSESCKTVISGNIVDSNYRGIYLDTSCLRCKIHSNTISNNDECGLKFFYYTGYNEITDNTVKLNGIGIKLSQICLYNEIYHNNFIDNTNQAADSNHNTWDNGYPSGGNYWSDHDCDGNPSNGSESYVINANNIDHYPFENKNGWIAVPKEPDLTLTSSDISLSNENPVEEENISINATIHNVGDANAANIKVQFFDDNPVNGGTQIGMDQSIGVINAGGSESVSVAWGAIAGSHDIYVAIDPDDEIKESNETNNNASKNIVVGIATTVTIDSANGSRNSVVKIPVSVDNPGGMAAARFSVCYNSSVVVVTDVERGIVTTDFALVKDIDNISGNVRVAMIGIKGVNESGSIAVISFKLVGDVSASTTLNLSDVYLCDEHFSLIEVSAVENGTITIEEETEDTEEPVINSVKLSDYETFEGYPIEVTVNATDNVGVTNVNVTAQEIELTHQSGDIWKGTIIAERGINIPVNVTAKDAAGNTAYNNTRTYNGTKDTSPPEIMNVNATSITSSSVTVTWETDDFSDSMVKYGKESKNYTMMEPDQNFTYNHSISLTGLSPNSTYYYVVNSTNPSGNGNQSAEYNFTTTTAAAPTFDTGSSTYPSISGTHNGTIMPNQTITVHKMYTYPCTGTGGRSEYVRIWNNSGLDVNATWNGYNEDWHNITFNEPEPFTLVKGQTYNYTIRTGSYPQIIHATEFNVTGGMITCEEFIDINGKKYNDWIPAIRLFL